MKSQLEANIDKYRLQPDVVNGEDISIIQSDSSRGGLTCKQVQRLFL